MNQQSKTFASVSGVCIATAAVIGAVLATVNHDDPGQTPAGNQVSVSVPATPSPSVVTVTASPTPVVAVKVSPSKKAAPRQAVVQDQGDPVTDPQPVDPQPVEQTSQPEERVIDQGTGTVGDDGIRRAPAPPTTRKTAPAPDPKQVPPPPQPIEPAPNG